MKSRSFIVGATALGLLVTASCVLAAYVWSQKIITANGGSSARIFEPASFATQKEQINSYLFSALKIHADLKESKITRAEAKKQILLLNVPAVLRDQHLKWVLALDAGRDSVIEDMMQEYSTLTLVK